MTDYLWDKSGEPDAEIERLEKLLAVYRQERAFVFPHPVTEKRSGIRVGKPAIGMERPGWSWPLRVAAFGAAVVILFAITIAITTVGSSDVEWQASRSAGDPKVNAKVIGGREELDVGSVVTTDAKSEAELKAGGHGRIRVLPGSEVRLVQSGARHQRLELQHGAIEASLYAPPFMFSVDTPSGTAYDIGCAFRLSVDEQRRGMLEVLSGWVQFEVGYQQSLAPAGTEVEIEPGFPPGTPVYKDSSADFRQAISRLDFGDAGERTESLKVALQQARAKDVYTLLRLMRTASPEERGMIFDRARELKLPPAWVTREGIMRREEAMMDAWSTSLGLGDAKRWWINWKDRF